MHFTSWQLNKLIGNKMDILKKTLISSVITTICISSSAFADSWNITQTTTPANSTTLLQTNSTSGSVQAMNATDSASSDVNGGSIQSVNMGNHRLELKQDSGTSSSTQAANYMKANTVGIAGASGLVTQEVKGVGGSWPVGHFIQNGSNNTQVGNMVDASTIKNLKQSYSTNSNSQHVHLDQKGGGNNNTQSVNMVKASSSIDTVEQIATGSEDYDLSQYNGTNNTQVVNNVDATGVNIGNKVKQKAKTFGYSTDSFSQRYGVNNIQAMNMVRANNIAELSQLSEGRSQYLNQYRGNGNTQAENYLNSTGTVALSNQEWNTVSYSKLDQSGDGATTGNIQVGNLAKVTTLTSGTQTTAANGQLQETQRSMISSLQSANAVLTDGATTGGTIAQTVSANSLPIFNQISSTNSIQATNFLGQMPN